MRDVAVASDTGHTHMHGGTNPGSGELPFHSTPRKLRSVSPPAARTTTHPAGVGTLRTVHACMYRVKPIPPNVPFAGMHRGFFRARGGGQHPRLRYCT